MDCPLCLEEIDLSDANFKPCPCGYQVRNCPKVERSQDDEADQTYFFSPPFPIATLCPSSQHCIDSTFATLHSPLDMMTTIPLLDGLLALSILRLPDLYLVSGIALLLIYMMALILRRSLS
jgi:hypothetical protein